MCAATAVMTSIHNMFSRGALLFCGEAALGRHHVMGEPRRDSDVSLDHWLLRRANADFAARHWLVALRLRNEVSLGLGRVGAQLSAEGFAH